METTLEKKSVPDGNLLREAYLCQHHELQILFDISSALHSSPHLQDVLHQALMAILHTLKFKMGAIYLFKETAEDQCLFELATQHGFSSTLFSAIHHLPMNPKTMENFLRREPVRWFPTSKIYFKALKERMYEEGVNEIICICLMTKNRILGLLYVTNDGILPLRTERREFLKTIGNQIGAAIENAQLFDSVERAKSELEISFDAIQHSIFIVDTRSRVYRINRTSESVYGPAQDLIGRRYTKILYEQEDPIPECPIRKCFETMQPVQWEGPHPRWGGIYHYYAFPVHNAAGSMERVVYYEKDITEEKKLEHRLQQSERLKALGTLAAGIAHEIRNPLATINFNTQMLIRELSLDSTQQQMFDDMVQEVKKIDRIVQQVLHFARPREPQFLPNRLNEIVTYCYDLAKVSLRKANVEVCMELEDDLPSLVMDFNQISQVVMNLVINAIEAMPKGGKLSLRTERCDDPPSVVLLISDTGSGIMAEDKERIFDPFFTRKSEGTGLGLSISRQILEKHGAYMDFDSSPGAGTTFRVAFPLVSDVKR